MPRVFVPQRVGVGDVLTIAGDDGHHYTRVLRARESEPIAVAAAGVSYLGKVVTSDAKVGEMVVKIESRMDSHEPMLQVTVVQGLAKGDKIEEIVEKCTESGASRFIIFPSVRTVVRLGDAKIESRLLRWNKVAREAAAQSQRDVVPSVAYAKDRSGLRNHLSEAKRVLLLDESETTMGIRQALKEIQDDATCNSIAIVIGPEGGFADEEREWFHDNLGAVSVTLGPRILRTENAGLMALSAALYEYHDLGG